MTTVIEGMIRGEGAKIGVVVSRFNSPVTERLLTGALDTLKRHGVAENDIIVVWVPGAVEIPLAAAKVAEGYGLDAVITLGAVIRGETSHYDYVCSQVASGVSKVGLDSGIPIIFGVLTTETSEQAFDRAGLKAGNKGVDAALAALEMVAVCRSLASPQSRLSRAK